MTKLRFRPPEGLTGYCMLGGIAGLSGPMAPGLIAGAFMAMILGWLFKASRWLYQRELALWRDIKALRIGNSPQALVSWKNKLIERRAGLDRQSKIIWFSCLIGAMLVFGLMPPRLAGELFAWIFLGALGLIISLFVLNCFHRLALAKAVQDQSNRKS